MVWGAAGGIGLTAGLDDKKGIVVGGAAAKGDAAGLTGKLGRPGFSVPMGFNSLNFLVVTMLS